MRFIPATVVAAAFLSLWVPQARAQSKGLPPQWDLKQTLTSLTQRTNRLLPILAQVKPGEWIAKGAPKAYGEQLTELRNQIGYLARSANELIKQPERVSKALETFLRLQSVEAMMNSMIEGIRRYQNPAVADLLQGIMNENGDLGQRLQDYLVDLVATKETEYKIVDEEAQRCRSELIRQPAPRTKSSRRKK